MLNHNTAADLIGIRRPGKLRPGWARRIGMSFNLVNHRRRAQTCLAVGLLFASACGSEQSGASPGDGGTTVTETTQKTETTVDLRRGAPLRADADPWPEDFGDVVPGVWYQLDRGVNRTECTGPILWLPGQSANDLGELVFFESQRNDLTAFVGTSPAGGVGRVNEDGDLEYTVDGVNGLLIWEPKPIDELADYPFECD